MNKIIINQHNYKDNEVVLHQGVTTLGRASDNMIQLPDPAISSHHARIVTIFDASYIEDLGSTNGTVVNDRKVQRHPLRHGDILSLGKMQLLFVNEAAARKSIDVENPAAISKTEPQAISRPLSPPATVNVSSGADSHRPQPKVDEKRAVNTEYFEHPDIDLSAGESSTDSGVESEKKLHDITREGIPTLDETLPLGQMRMKSSHTQVTRKPDSQRQMTYMFSEAYPVENDHSSFAPTGSLDMGNEPIHSGQQDHEDIQDMPEISNLRAPITGWKIFLAGIFVLTIVAAILFKLLWDIPLL